MSDLPFPDLRQHLVPETLVYVKTFSQEPGGPALDDQIAQWVRQTGNLIVMPGPVAFTGVGKSIAVTYVSAVEENYDAGRKAPQAIQDERVEQISTGMATDLRRSTPEHTGTLDRRLSDG